MVGTVKRSPSEATVIDAGGDEATLTAVLWETAERRPFLSTFVVSFVVLSALPVLAFAGFATFVFALLFAGAITFVVGTGFVVVGGAAIVLGIVLVATFWLAVGLTITGVGAYFAARVGQRVLADERGAAPALKVCAEPGPLEQDADRMQSLSDDLRTQLEPYTRASRDAAHRVVLAAADRVKAEPEGAKKEVGGDEWNEKSDREAPAVSAVPLRVR